MLSLAVCLAATVAEASERIALVIGNSNYIHAAPLDHVAHDTAVMADTLRSLDFDVEALSDLSRPLMQSHLEAFGRRLDQAGEGTIGLLFYAGHGFRHDGSNYLLPVGTEIAVARDIEAVAINLDLTLAEIAFASTEHKLVILDVPPDRAVSDRIGVNPGLAAIDAPVGTLVAYGALPSDRSERPRHQGLYPLALANVLAKPGLMVEQVFQEVRLNFAAATDGLQIPWESSALTSPIYLAGRPAPGEEQAVANGVIRLAKTDPRTADLVLWSRIKDSDNPSDFADYLIRFPEGVFRTLAEHRLTELAELDLALLAPRDPAPRIESRTARLITQKRANVRAEPSSDGIIVATLEPNQHVDVTGDVIERDWLRVRLANDVEAFIWEPLLDSAPPLDDQQAGLAATLPPSKSALLGQWQGEFYCQWDTIGFTLDISDEIPGGEDSLRAVFSFFPLPGTPSMPSGSFFMEGDYDPEDGTIILEGRDWIEQPHGFQRHNLAGRAEIGGGLISGRIETPGCSDFHLARHGDQRQSSNSSISTQ